MKRRREGTLGKTSYEKGEKMPVGSGFAGLEDFLTKTEAFAASLKEKYPAASLAAEQADFILAHISGLKRDINGISEVAAKEPEKLLARVKQIAYRAVVITSRRWDVMAEIKADKKRSGLTVQTYLAAVSRLKSRSVNGKFLRKELARNCAMSLQKLREWEAKNIE